MNDYADKKLFGDWCIPDITKPIGVGSYGTVYELRSDTAKSSVTAVKIISIPKNKAEYDAKISAVGASEEEVRKSLKEAKDNLINEVEMMLKVGGFTNCVGCMTYEVIDHEGCFGWDILIQMEKLESLDANFRNKGEVTNLDIVRLGIDMCSALESCELYNIVHRDIKPANIMVKNIDGKKAIYKLGDFGVAKVLGDGGTMTMSGTFDYMAPELLRGEGDKRVDIYSLGIVMYELLNANRLPFLPDYPKEISQSDVAKSRQCRLSDVPKEEPLYSKGTELAKVVLKACEYDRDKRYNSAAEMRADLQKVLAEENERVIFSVPPIGPYKPSERKIVVKILGNCQTVTYDGKEHQVAGFTSNGEKHRIKVELKPNSKAIAKGKKAGEYSMGLTKESFDVTSLDDGLDVENVVVQDGKLIIEESKPGKTKKEKKNSAPKPEKKKASKVALGAVAVIALLAVILISSNVNKHQWKAATYDSPQICEKCGESRGVPVEKVSISAGSKHAVGLKADGTVVAAGNHMGKEWGTDTWTDIVAVAAGNNYTLGLKSDGTVVRAGSDYYVNDKSVSQWKDVTAISAGNSHAAVLLADGTVEAVGDNVYKKCDVSSWSGMVAISCGYSHTLGLKSDGTVLAVGDNSSHACDVSSWTDIIAISAGEDFSLGLKSDGTVLAVGKNTNGQCNVALWKDIVAISAGSSYAAGLKSDGTVVLAGYDDNSPCDTSEYTSTWTNITEISVGDGFIIGLKSNGTIIATGNDSYGQCNGGYWSDITAIATGDSFSAGLRKDGTLRVADNKYSMNALYGWSDIKAISLGTGYALGLNSDGTVQATGSGLKDSFDFSNWTDIMAISAGDYHAVGLNSNGKVVATGDNKYGETEVKGWTDIVSVAAGKYYTAGLKSDGSVVLTGSELYDQSALTAWNDIVAISAGNYHLVGLKSDGTVLALGYNDEGQCIVNNWSNITAVAAGGKFTAGLRSDGTVVITDNDTIDMTDLNSWTDIVSIAAGDNFLLGLKSDGTIIAAGDNTNAQCDVTLWKNIGRT
jgi:serine/threonine protein kinase